VVSSPFIGSVRAWFCRRSLAPLLVATLVAWFGVVAQPLAGKGPDKKNKIESKLDRELQRTLRDGGKARVIVRPRPGRIQDVKQRLGNKARNAKIDLKSVGAFTAELDAADLAALASDQDVESISSDAPVRSFGDVAETAAAADTLLEILGTDDTELDGDHVGIAVVDSGLDNKDDFDGGRTKNFWNFIEQDEDHPFDDYGHGTHVSGVVTGTGKRSPVRVRGNLKKERELA
jgi:subtilisin family serine protease